MPETKDPAIIVDTSTLIALDKLGLIHILKDLYSAVNVPEAVLLEFGQDLPHWFQVQSVKQVALLTLMSDKLGDGESEVIAIGIEKNNCVVVLDDLKARNTARKLGLRLTGLLGILVKAKQRGKIIAVKPLLEKLDTEEFRISEKLKAVVLSAAGE